MSPTRIMSVIVMDRDHWALMMTEGSSIVLRWQSVVGAEPRTRHEARSAYSCRAPPYTIRRHTHSAGPIRNRASHHSLLHT